MLVLSAAACDDRSGSSDAAPSSGRCLGPVSSGDSSLEVSAESIGPGSESFPVTASGMIEDTVFVVSRHMSLRPGLVAGFDAADGGLTYHEDVVVDGEASHGTWGATVSGDSLYVGMSFDGPRRSAIMRLDPEEGELVEVGSTAPARLIWDMTTAPDGTVYAVTSRQNNAGLWEYDPDEDTTEFLGHFQNDTRQDARSVAATEDTVYIGLGNASADLIAYDRESGDSRSVLPEELEGATFVYSLEATEDVLAVGTRSPATLTVIDSQDPEHHEVFRVPTGTVQSLEIVGDTVYFTSGSALWRHELGGESPERLADLELPGGQTRGMFHRDGTLHGVGNLGHLWSYDLEESSSRITDLDSGGRGEDPQGEPAQSLAVVDGVVYTGGHFTIGVRELATGELDQVYVPGEPKDVVAHEGTLYLAMYSSGELIRLDPETGEHEVVAESPSGHDRPRALTLDDDSGRLVMAVQADSGGAGSVTVHDSATEESYTIAPFADLASSAVVASDGVAYVAGSSGMQDGDDDAQVAAVDLRTGGVMWTTAPVDGAGVITGLALEDDRLRGLTADGAVFVLDTQTRDVVVEDAGLGPGGLLTHQGEVYGATEEKLFHLDPETGQARVLLEDLDGEWFTWPGLASDGCHLYTMSGSEVLQVGIPGEGSETDARRGS
ncbi:hypothetical protein BCY76_013260 [Nesterenkonia sp. PF2B19]|nr:hypothetical protein BCY76_013260 [Nesterenkonia sp. PF2B19]